VVRSIRAGTPLARGFKQVITHFDELFKKLPSLAAKLQFRRTSFAHLFKEGLEASRKDSLRAEYLRLCDQLREFARTADFEKLIDPKTSPSSRAAIEKYTRDLMQNISGIVDRYGDLFRESYLVNAFTKRLYRGPTEQSVNGVKFVGQDIYLSLRIDAQHIIEKRVLPKWKDDWKLLGWVSEADMPAIPVMHEWHIPSPKKLMGLEGTKLLDETPIEDVFSLTKEMERDLPLDKFKSAEEYLSALKDFYRISVKNKRGDVVEPLRNFVKFVEQTEKELKKAKGGQAVVKALKELK
jgi:hypothetical protein